MKKRERNIEKILLQLPAVKGAREDLFFALSRKRNFF